MNQALLLSMAAIGLMSSCQRRESPKGPPERRPAAEESVAPPRTPSLAEAPPVERSPRVLESFTLPWDVPQEPCIATIEGPTGGLDGDLQLRITAPGRADSIFTLPGSLVPLKEDMAPELTKDNLLASRFLYLCPKLKDEDNNPALIFCGWSYGSDPGSLCILWPDGERAPIQVFTSKAFALDAIQPLETAGAPVIIGHASFSEGMGEGLETYDPYSVFRIGPNRQAVYDRGLSRIYNQRQYCWTDSNDRSGLLVVTNSPDGKPRVLPESAARALAASNRTKAN